MIQDREQGPIMAQSGADRETVMRFVAQHPEYARLPDEVVLQICTEGEPLDYYDDEN